MRFALDIDRSLTGRAWRWRGPEPCGSGGNLVDDLLRARGCTHDSLERERAPTIRSFLPDPSIFQDMDRAAERLAAAVIDRESVTIFGDYDVDGATSAALLVRLLRELGLDAGVYIPDRLMEGYGPSGEALVALARSGASLVVTVDCGAQAFAALEAARSVGLDVIVVDHHKCAASLPPALALVNPNRLDEADEAAGHGHLAAVGVAFLLGAALVRTLRARGWFAARPEPRLLDLLDLVALGTVADVAPIRGLNRAFVAQGLKTMARRGNIGLNALLSASRLERAPQCSDLGFALGPRINAGGRVGRSDLGVRLLTTADPDEAAMLAAELDHLNQERRAIEATVQEEAEALLTELGERSVAVIAGDLWHPGVIGIVAGRLKEKITRPAIVIAIDEDGIGKGSGRSITGVDLGAAILAAKDHGLLVAGGGHAMAAGLTVRREHVTALAEFLEERLREDVARAATARALLIDLLVAPAGLTPELIQSMEQAGPFGNGWPAPRVALGPVRVVRADIVGTSHVRAIVAGEDGRSLKAMAFRQAETELGQMLLSSRAGTRFWLAGRAKIDDWGPRPAAELHIEDLAIA
ncbi:single-stranded-DNA-specific exonuclease RecJ [Sphingobium sp. B12D2B]|uniref:single-stranded-DNA-specific exonuclease RecJ n=1 Tax=Sphingobium sp. B12D2B TaxID=2940577 RepID=UPI0022250F90|nr:single-stranded-DNA-specific exonuclease RecJ [Sphingobium sp. B12D2B]MCW2350263.1 single-stranded-DNA-specific exonuclease [Sphingobium sp. B12D2B]